MTKLQGIIARQKTKLERGYSYVGIPGMGIVIASTLQEHLFPHIPLWFLYPIGMCIVWTVGYIDIRLGFLEAESEHKGLHNPLTTEMLHRLEKGYKGKIKQREKWK